MAVSVRVLQKADAPARFAVPIDAHRIVGHLGNPQSAVCAPVDRYRIHNERFGRDELQLKPIAHVNLFHGLGS